MGVNVDHRTFVIKRALPGSPAHAFRFWSDRALKRQWNACHPDWHVLEDRFDFRVDGCERLVWRMPQGIVQEMTAHFLEIAERQRIVYAYTMRTDGRSISSSLVTVEFESTPTGTEMTFTEQAMFADVKHAERRESGTGVGFDRLYQAMEAASVG
ncbi:MULTISPECIES: SRPBCC domain-containing protein [unclassified Ensifer]|uniref:SRPBCC domain-containing protein n=1 Tax=unclassified Ensifer TaxID=2633371 RepID=UPI00070F170B|nr:MULTISPECIES: SRPBCC domain-containing protein [unclassified Ensifer]KQW34804.1 ATPase [Ensifer sp. Root1252]KRC57128.1 ATPase [Ensifer sp. Root231]KRC87623.1 ATPase [Ensifer sp. Root258]